MRRFTAAALTALVLTGSTGAPAAQDTWPDPALHQALATCIATNHPPEGAEPWQRLVDLEARCPRVFHWLEDATAKGWLTPSSTRAPGHAALEALASQLAAPDTRLPTAPDPAALAPLLEQLTLSADDQPGLWSRFLRWLATTFDLQHDDLDWLNEFAPSDATLEFMGKAALALCVLLALLFVGNELRLFGLRGRAAPYRSESATDASPASTPLTWGSLATLSPRERLRGAWTLLARDLELPQTAVRAQSLTGREMVRALRRHSPGRGARLAELLTASEPVLYGGRETTDAEAERLAEGCRALTGDDATPAPDPRT